MICIFFFQAEDGIRDYKVTGVQTCALPIWLERSAPRFQGAYKERSSCNAVPANNPPNLSMPLLELHPLHCAKGWGDQFSHAESPAGAWWPCPLSSIFDGAVGGCPG